MTTTAWQMVFCDDCSCIDIVGGGGISVEVAEKRATKVGWRFTGKGPKRHASCPAHHGGSRCSHDGSDRRVDRPHHVGLTYPLTSPHHPG